MCEDGGGKRVKEEVRWCERSRPAGVWRDILYCVAYGVKGHVILDNDV